LIKEIYSLFTHMSRNKKPPNLDFSLAVDCAFPLVGKITIRLIPSFDKRN